MYRILLVDDEAQERQGITWLIQKYQLPFIISEASNGQKAEEYIKSHPVDVLFTDVKMPYKDGLELAKEVYRWNPDIKIVIFSAYGEFDYAKRAMEARAVDYLLKPIELDEFERVMHKVIGELEEMKARAEKENRQEEESIKGALYKVFTGGTVPSQYGVSLGQYLEGMGKERKLLLSFESGGRLFEEREKEYMTLLKTWLPQPWEYVNLYPDTAWVLMNRPPGFPGGAFAGCLEKLRRDIRMVLREECSVIVSREFTNAEEMADCAAEINDIRRNYYGNSGAVLCLSEFDGTSDYYAAELERIKQQMMEAIRGKEEDMILLYGTQLVETMARGRMVSRIYVYHVFFQVLSELYNRYGVTDKTRLLEKLDELLSYRDREKLSVGWKEILGQVFSGQGEETDSGRITERIQAIVREEYRNDISLDEIAGRVGMASAYVSYLFKKETGSNLVKYITDYRMEQARRFLEDSEMKIVQVGKACGYENQPYFNRLFKNYYGMTPKQYRESHGKY